MLQSIHIENYALIERLDIDFTPGFSVITGETGAGKSIILGAIGLLLGQRADTKAIKNNAPKCVVEAHFRIKDYGLESFFSENDIDYDAEDCILRREVSANGKSRAFINDTPATLSQLKVLGESLIDIHSQHQNLLLNKEEFQLNIVDIIAQDSGELSAYQMLHANYKQVCRQLDDLISSAEKGRQDEDFIRFQLEQLENADLKEDEQDTLEQEADLLNHAEDIKASLYKVSESIENDEAGILTSAGECLQTLQNILQVYPQAGEWYERLNSCYIELKDIVRDISNAQENIDFNPSRLDYVNERLNLIYSLQQKHHVNSIKDLIELTKQYRENLQTITSFDENIEALKKEKQELYEKVLEQASVLSRLRMQSARKIEEKMQSLLIPLGMPNVRFSIEITPKKEPDSKGMDRIAFLFSANKNGKMQNLADIASGGEIARVMLSLKAMIAGAVKLPTIIFDEIDTGVSGSIAERMAIIMQDMGERDRQVISITHLPQIAARGTTHYKVYKEDTDTGTNSYIRMLTREERVHEIANMLSGAQLTEAALNNARELLGFK